MCGGMKKASLITLSFLTLGACAVTTPVRVAGTGVDIAVGTAATVVRVATPSF